VSESAILISATGQRSRHTDNASIKSGGVQSVELGIIVRFEDAPTPWRLFASCFWKQPAGLLACMHLEKPPPDEDDEDESETSNGPVLGMVSTQHVVGWS
jgi:hypothetical protein